MSRFRKRWIVRAFSGFLTFLFLSTFASPSLAQTVSASQRQAKLLLEKISGTKIPSDHSLLAPMVAKIDQNDLLGAAQIATTHPNFLNVTVKQMALKMSTREETMRLKLNDFAASFIGVTRDETDARELLNGNFIYMADATKIPANVTVRSNLVNDVARSNNHYNDLDNVRVDIGQVLMRITNQPLASSDDSTATIINNPDPAGVLTSRTFMSAHAIDGTNRRPVEFTFREFMCNPIQNWADIKVSDQRIGRDIDRFPGGDNMKFVTSCKGCHSVMDGFRGAFGKWDAMNNRPAYGGIRNGGSFSGAGIANKMNKNNTVFPDGFVTRDDSFINNARGTANANLFGWRDNGAAGGNGVKEFGNLIANSEQFSRCMVKRVYEATCRRTLDITSHQSYVEAEAKKFEQNAYNLKRLFQDVAISSECL